MSLGRGSVAVCSMQQPLRKAELMLLTLMARMSRTLELFARPSAANLIGYMQREQYVKSPESSRMSALLACLFKSAPSLCEMGRRTI